MEKNLKISLVIPAYNEEKYIGECLDSVLKNSRDKFFEIIVVDNNSTDQTSFIAGQKKGVRVVRESDKGLTKARQRGLDEAHGDYVAYIDADTRMPAGWIEKVEKAFSSRPDFVCLSGPYTYYDGSRFVNFINTILWRIFAPITYRIVGYMVLGGNFVAKKDALVRMGGFDKTIGFYGEDTDIARRLHKFGKVVFRMDFSIPSSSRRFAVEGLIKTNIIYGVNFVWEVLFHRPFTKSHKNIRT